MSIKPLPTHYSMENHATIFDEESLTALQLAARTTGKVNEAVKAFNDLEDTTNERLEAQDEAVASMIDKTLPNLVVTEVQSTVDDGTFDGMIERKYGVMEKRLENLLGSVDEGTSTLDAEIIDGRVDRDGNIHVNLGGSIRAASDKSDANLQRYLRVNKLNPDAMTSGYVSLDGTVWSSSDYHYTDYIAVGNGEKIALFDGNRTACKMRYVVAYDHNREVIAGRCVENVYCFTQSDNVNYIRVSIANSYAPFSNLALCAPDCPFTAPYGERCVNDEGYVYNLFNKNAAQLGYYVNYSNGVITPNEYYNASGLIAVKPGRTYSLFTRNMRKLVVRMWGFYTVNGGVLVGGENLRDITIPEDVYAIIFCTQIENGIDLMFAESDAITFAEYGKPCVRGAAVPKQLYKNGGCFQANIGDISVATVDLSNFPHYTRKNTTVTASAEFDSFVDFTVGRGKGVYYGTWVTVKYNKIEVYTHHDEITPAYTFTGVPVSKFACVTLATDNSAKMTITVISDGGHVQHEIACDNLFMGLPFVSSNGSAKNVRVTGGCSDLVKSVWIFGDSYLGYDEVRVMHYIRDMTNGGYLHCAIGGLNSYQAMLELDRCLALNRPNVLVWYLGMNDTDEDFEHYVNEMKNLCESYGVELVLNRVPTVPERSKENQSRVVLESGCRYIDSYSAVGSNENGEWTDDYLAGDNVHPTYAGARVLAVQMLHDVPELVMT